MSLDSLTNKGMVVLHPSNKELQKTIIVVGVARGGTSIVAGALKHLGVPMGNACAPVFEDTRLSFAFEKQSKEKFEQVITDYNEKQDVWAWKRPSSLNDLSRIAKKLRNPHFIFVFRDLLSVANRNTISMKQGVVGGLDAAFNDYKKILRFLNKSSHPALLVSSEKAVKHKQSFVVALIEFADLQPSEAQCQQSLNFITPNPSNYLRVSRIDNVIGWADKKQLQVGLLTGWAYRAHNKKQVNLTVYVNDKALKTISASEFNAAFKGKVHPTGHCGFSINLLDYDVKPSDHIQVKAEGDEVPVSGIELNLTHLQQWLLPGQLFVEPKGAINLSLLQTGLLRGWAIARSYDAPAKVEVYVNGEKFLQLHASIKRDNLQKIKIHPTGTCGFDFDLKLYGIKPIDELEVKLQGSEIVLYRRKKMFPELSAWLTTQELKHKNELAQNAN
ncbi:hypothetical protein MT390_09140 [Vibrio sp. 2-Bac 85]